MLVEPLADVPAGRNDSIWRGRFDVVHSELNEIGCVPVPAVPRLSVRARQRDRVAVDRVVDDAYQLTVYTHAVTVQVALVGELEHVVGLRVIAHETNDTSSLSGRDRPSYDEAMPTRRAIR